MNSSFILSCCLFLMFSFCTSSCHAQKVKKNKKISKEQRKLSDPKVADNSSARCDPTTWKYVYNPDRLKVITECKTVTGTIEESSSNEDGDHHMLLKLDAGQEDLLTAKNIKRKQGYLVIEAVCANNTSLKKVGATCNGYVNKVQIPRVGEHVKVTGSYVIDSHNGWAEIHPITKIEKF